MREEREFKESDVESVLRESVLESVARGFPRWRELFERELHLRGKKYRCKRVLERAERVHEREGRKSEGTFACFLTIATEKMRPHSIPLHSSACFQAVSARRSL